MIEPLLLYWLASCLSEQVMLVMFRNEILEDYNERIAPGCQSAEHFATVCTVRVLTAAFWRPLQLIDRRIR